MFEKDWRTIQSRLSLLGFDPGPIDGVRGPRTDAAIVAFKKSVGLRARAYYGPLTHQALMSVPKPETHVPWFAEAQKMMGIHEQRDVSQLSNWFYHTVAWLDPREVPWCGAFVETCFKLWDPSCKTPSNPLGARNWSTFGMPMQPCLGAVLVFWRGSPSGWKGHVGFYRGEDETHFHVLGGNQKNAVTVTRISKDRLLDSRWPRKFPFITNKVHVSSNGVPVSRNEA
ncbi:hypothetical protein RAZWK3B_16600 [Roseobacter sp. AzwK-3b]|uniref:NlpC/P60 family protein n=1 Tax=Roseobacter sp. AzwK-3b TaxID=351016 RepID=UPI0001569879|nr:TIGR02594 family protein [Roseobacter sp. AzwK-3b]EDM71035.1 hypothetical protein RAZWK3B_16600 [Roseobacter sp. AzwK-3b]